MTTSQHANEEGTLSAHDDHGLAHVMPLPVLIGVFLALMVLTVITVKVRDFEFGDLNLWVAMIIATVKATLVILYFMHLRYDNPFNAFVFAAALVFLGLFLIICMLDTMHYTPAIDAYRSVNP